MSMQPIVFKVRDKEYALRVLGEILPRIRSLAPSLASTSITYQPDSIIVDAPLFNKSDKSDGDVSIQALLWLLEALTRINQDFLLKNPYSPDLYSSGAVYKPEMEGTENWQDIPTTLALGDGDCEDLACFMAAQLRSQGVPAKAYLRWQMRKGSYRFHALTQLPDGTIEDPSLKLGMRDYADYLAST